MKFAFLLPFLPGVVLAQAVPEISTERELLAELAVQGISTHEVNWTSVNALCGVAASDKPTFYRCRLANGVKQVNHQRAAQSCHRKSDNLLIQRRSFGYGFANDGTFRRPPTRYRREYFENCMQDAGYHNSQDWRAQ